MALNPVTKEELEQGQAELRKGIPEAPAPVNLNTVAQLGSYIPLEYRGREYKIEPPSWDKGLELQVLYTDIQNIEHLNAGRGTAGIMAGIFRSAIKIMGNEMIPAKMHPTVHRVFRHILPNPLRKASEGEIGFLLGFFWRHRTTSTVKEL